MIRHRPTGSGHPYATTEDQRVPAFPVDGDPLELRVRAAPSVRSVVCEWTVDGGPPVVLDLAPVRASDGPGVVQQPAGQAHQADVQHGVRAP
ncbi:hypothetical protein AB0B89_27460, partial [Sphaerisporangium sp. NPDC049002]|uniref:hypothetical protein n=1 Tax=Sphaerisporangium sp. NPDC049002 TaxID=3155392 RepID=UPI0033FAE6D3